MNQRSFSWSSFLLLTVFCWVAVAAFVNTALPHDMAEQFVWAQTWQWGYPKHPPLPTWLFKLVLLILPVGPLALYFLAAVCISLTGLFTYWLSFELFGSRALALFSLAAWTLQQPYSWRAWMFNHNSVLVLFVAASAYATIRAVKSNSKGWWTLLGIFSAGALLAKFQAGLPLLGLFWVLLRTGALGRREVRQGVYLAFVICVMLILPYAWWVFNGNIDSLTYATKQLGGGHEGQAQRLLVFFLVNLRYLSLVLVFALGWVLFSLRNSAHTPAQQPLAGANLWIWCEGLLFIPVVGILGVFLIGGSQVPAYWGVETFQFFSVFIVCAFRDQLSRLNVNRAMFLVVVIHFVGMAVALSPAMKFMHAKGTVQGYPSKLLAERVAADWSKTSACPLRYVVAPFFEGGQLAAWIPGFPAVFEDGDLRKSPWIQPDDVRLKGSVILYFDEGAQPKGTIHTPEMVLPRPVNMRELHTVYWAISLPATPCSKSAN